MKRNNGNIYVLVIEYEYEDRIHTETRYIQFEALMGEMYYWYYRKDTKIIKITITLQ